MRSHGQHVSGRTYANHYTYWFEIKDGKFTQLREWLDTLHGNDVLCGQTEAIDFETRRDRPLSEGRMNLQALEAIELQDSESKRHRLGDLWADRRVVLVFARHFG